MKVVMACGALNLSPKRALASPEEQLLEEQENNEQLSQQEQ